MGTPGAEVIDLTEFDDDAPKEASSSAKSTKSASQHTPNSAGTSRLTPARDVKKSTTRDNPIVISDEDQTVEDYGENARKRRKRYRSVEVGVGVGTPNGAVAGKNGRSDRTSKDAGALPEESSSKRRKRQSSKNDSSKLANGNGTMDTSRRATIPAGERVTPDPRDVEGRTHHYENNKSSRRERREERRFERDADRSTRDPGLYRDAAIEETDTTRLFVVDYGQPQTEAPPQPDQTTSQVLVKDEFAGLSNDDNNLILPSHVSITATAQPDETMAQDQPLVANDSDDDDFIKFLDYDDVQRGVPRYFDEASNEKQSTFACRHCGAEGDHKTIDCPVMICLTCGARNEHSTRGCPISKTCFTCGIKGHINSDCPNRYGSHRVKSADRMHDCDRCGSHLHTAKECPTLWRMYEYVSDSRRDEILKRRREKEGFQFGEGGEGFIGEDLWCYNCGDEGHLGDDCDLAPRPPEFPREPSAFGRFNILSGPFADAAAPSSSRSRKQREWEVEGYFDDGYGFSGPSNVGKRGRDKEKERMRQRAFEADYDDDDWFGSRGDSRRTGPQSTSHPPPLGPKRSGKDSSSTPRGKGQQKPGFEVHLHKNSSAKKPNLLDRMESGKGKGKGKSDSPARHGDGRHSSDNRSKRDRERDRERDKDRGKDRDRDRDRERERQKNRNGPTGSRDKPERDGRNGGGHDSSSRRKYYGGYGT
ncbi:hypothetical protein SCHPADRAFT_926593 [Schizopora paradoxa]|uniref:CCHC-type domain-containing protein n=1 Tax=Schizopora paradoxa TaxID=27342 RepID=A0A0H2RWC3_9AGAM|nr:hypothetical protein SCHPADRAFT_926593 [Schizopora paradoxa]